MLSSLKTCALLEENLNDDKSKNVLLSEQVFSILKFDTPPKFKDLGVPTISCYIGNHKRFWFWVLVLI